MPMSEWIEKLGRAIFESPFDALKMMSSDSPEMAEIRLALLDEIKARSHRVGGRDVFPYNVVRVHLDGVPESQSGIFRDRFFVQFCEQELHSGLKKANYRFPADLSVEIETTPDLPGPKGRWFTVDVESRSPKPSAAVSARRSARLVVLKGSANETELPLNKARTNIGRGADVYRTDGPLRRNDLAFTEDDEISRTASREHAHIDHDKQSNEYRLFNDRTYKAGSACGLWVIRDGLSMEVHRSTKGFLLQPGDEIHFGRAVARFAGR